MLNDRQTERLLEGRLLPVFEILDDDDVILVSVKIKRKKPLSLPRTTMVLRKGTGTKIRFRNRNTGFSVWFDIHLECRDYDPFETVVKSARMEMCNVR